MQVTYLKGNHDSRPTFIATTSTKTRARADLVTYNQTTNVWTTYVKTFDLRKIGQKRDYLTFLEQFFESNSQEYNTARGKILNLTPRTALPNNLIEPVIPIEELLQKIKDYEDSKKNNPK